MADGPDEIVGRKCGNCEFGQRSGIDINTVECFGHPPSVHVLGVTPDRLGRPQIQMEAFVPRVAANRPACSLYKFKVQILDLSRLKTEGAG